MTLVGVELFRGGSSSSPALFAELVALHASDRCLVCKTNWLTTGVFVAVHDRSAGLPGAGESLPSLTTPGGHPSPEVMVARLCRWLVSRRFVERGALLNEVVEQGGRVRPLLTLLLLEGGDQVLVPLLWRLGTCAPGSRVQPAALATLALTVVEDLVELQGDDPLRWSSDATALLAKVGGFLDDDVLASRVPVSFLLDAAAPVSTPCRFRVVRRETRSLSDQQQETFSLLLGEWSGPLRDLVEVARSL